MADKKKKPKKEEAVRPGKPAGFLRTRSDARSEQRFLPRNGPAAAISVLAMSLGALAVGAGVYGKFLRDAAIGSHPWSTWLLIGGAVMFGAAAFLGAMPAAPVRVGDGGVAVERGSGLDRLAWFEIDSTALDGGSLILRGSGRIVTVSTKAHPDAVARAVSEARKRIPNKAADLSGAPEGTGDGGEKMALEPLQLAGARCAETDRIIALDKDGRLCGRCEQRYHKDGVPSQCTSCDAPLA